MALGRDHDGLAGFQQGLDDSLLGIVGFVGKNRLRRGVRQQNIGTDPVMRLTGGQMEACRVTQGIHRGMDLRAQTAPAAANGLVLRAPFFGPALC